VLTVRRLLVLLLGSLLSPLVWATTEATPLVADPPDDGAHPASIVELTIPSHGARLPGHIYLAAGAGPHPTVVFLHGFPGNERNLDLAQALRRAGFNSLFFHYRGAWGAEGEYRIAHLTEDTATVLRWLRAEEQLRALRIDPTALSLLGHSLGGYTALAAGSQDPALRCVMALAPANLALWKDGAEDGGLLFERLQAYADSLFMLRGLDGNKLGAELRTTPREQLDTERFAPGLVGKSVLMIAGDRDQATPPAQMFDPVVRAYLEEPRMYLSTLKLPTDHSFSGLRLRLTEAILDWAGEHCASAP